MASGETLLAACLLLPIVCAVVVAILGKWQNVRDIATVLLALGTFGAVLQLALDAWPAAGASPAIGLELFELFPGVSLAFEVEPLGLVFALVASGLWILTSPTVPHFTQTIW